MRYMNAAHAAGYVGLSETYPCGSFFIRTNSDLGLLTDQEMTPRMNMIDLDKKGGSSCNRELIAWCMNEVQMAVEEVDRFATRTIWQIDTMVAGEQTDLDMLMRTGSATLVDGLFVFATLAEVPPGVNPRLQFHEAEGITLILFQSGAILADGITNFEFPCRTITLNVHSSLEAVGFLARIAKEGASKKTGVSPSQSQKFYHDHLFIPPDGR